MSYLGIGYAGTDSTFLRKMVNQHHDWLFGDRRPKFFGDEFIVLYDSNTAREFVQKCKLKSNDIIVYVMDKPANRIDLL